MDEKIKITPLERTKLWKQQNPDKLKEQKHRYYLKKKALKEKAKLAKENEIPE